MPGQGCVAYSLFDIQIAAPQPTLMVGRDYYNSKVQYEGIPQEFFLALPFSNQIPQGIAVFHEGFMATG
jgi:hypothetical protein